MTMTKYVVLLALIGAIPQASAQSGRYWSPLETSIVSIGGKRILVPTRAFYFRVDTAAIKEVLGQLSVGTLGDLAASRKVVEFPMPDGALRGFRALQTPVMPPGLQARYPMVRTYSGVAVDDPHVKVKFDLTPAGLHAMVLGTTGGDVFIDPVAMGDNVLHQAYFKKDLPLPAGRSAPVCTYDEVNDVAHAAAVTAGWIQQMGGERTGDCQFRTYRLALACTGEYANFFGATGTNKAPAIAAMATTLNRVNGVYERDATLTMVLVEEDDQLVFTDPVSDGYANNNGEAMLGQNQTKCDAIIGSSEYDIGHVLSTGGGGVAYLNSACTGNKAGGVTGLGAPVGDAFDIDYVAHEMGHQYGGNHTQNNNCNRSALAAREVGSGITIMGYAGVCPPNVADHSIAMFGGYSLQEVHANITVGNSSTCPLTVSTINSSPTVDAGPDRVIPGSTPFILTAEATDPDAGDTLTYSWEQMDHEVSTQPPVATSTGGPNFRPWPPTSEPERYFPKLTTIISGSAPSSDWEVLASVPRTYAFRVTVRDNSPVGGCNAQDDMQVTVDGGSGPFLVTQPNTSVTWEGGSVHEVHWNVAGTANTPVDCANVDILLSIDGGNSYPYQLATATSNTGSASITLPNMATTQARIMVRANGNVFFDISDVDFTITMSAVFLVRVDAKVWLEGPYGGSALMNDDLRATSLIPLAEPYTSLGMEQAGNGGGETCSSSVLAITGPDAVVDWVRLELRSPASPSELVCSRQALLQRDGDIVDTDGVSPVAFQANEGNYYLVVRHRNHLGCMTAAPLALSEMPTPVDLRDPATPTYGVEARKAIGDASALWMGNAQPDGAMKYTGMENDRDPVLVRIGGLPTDTLQGYYPEDCTMDGTVRYTGAGNDRDPILLNIGGVVPTAVRLEQVP
jgi:hypothetical protein